MEHNRINALVIDDSKMERHHASMVLRNLGVNCDQARDMYRATTLTELNEYDIIFINTHILGEEPQELVNSLLALPCVREMRIPIVEMGNGFRCEKPLSGCDGFLEKPLKNDAMRTILISVLPQDKSARIECHSAPDNGECGCKLLMLLDDGEAFNTAAGMKNCGSMESYLSAVKIFYDTTPGKSDEIEQLWKRGDIEGYTIKVHALKSSSRIIGALTLSKEAARLEDAGKNGDIELINKDTEKLLSDYRAIRERFAEMFEEEEEDKPLAPDSVLTDAFMALRDFAESMDFDLAKMVMDSLEEYSFREEDAKKIHAINDCLLALDWDGITELLNN